MSQDASVTETSEETIRPYAEYVRLCKIHYFEELFIQTNGNFCKMAKIAGMNRTGLYRSLQILGIDKDELAEKYEIQRTKYSGSNYKNTGNAAWQALGEDE